jgi:YD repeat-containing protein
MSSTTFTVHTGLQPSEVLAVMTDFGPGRPERWPNIDAAHFEVHDSGPDWAEVTEGTSMGWERERYAWDAAAGTIEITTLDSNLWASGSGWHYQLTPSAAGTDVRVTLTRVPKSWQGRILGALIPIVGGRTLGKQLEKVFRSAESR